METADWIALIAIIVSIVSFILSFYLAWRSSKAEIRPVLAIFYESKTGWNIKNIGNGPALNVVVAQRRPLSGEWIRPVRIPPMPVGGDFHLEWMAHDNDHGIGAYYEDFQGRVYSSICGDDLTRIFKGNQLAQWENKDIGRHWWRDPTKPTAPGELRVKD